jgi:hypothetical protein
MVFAELLKPIVFNQCSQAMPAEADNSQIKAERFA